MNTTLKDLKINKTKYCQEVRQMGLKSYMNNKKYTHNNIKYTKKINFEDIDNNLTYA